MRLLLVKYVLTKAQKQNKIERKKKSSKYKERKIHTNWKSGSHTLKCKDIKSDIRVNVDNQQETKSGHLANKGNLIDFWYESMYVQTQYCGASGYREENDGHLPSPNKQNRWGKFYDKFAKYSKMMTMHTMKNSSRKCTTPPVVLHKDNW